MKNICVKASDFGYTFSSPIFKDSSFLGIYKLKKCNISLHMHINIWTFRSSELYPGLIS